MQSRVAGFGFDSAAGADDEASRGPLGMPSHTSRRDELRRHAPKMRKLLLGLKTAIGSGRTAKVRERDMEGTVARSPRSIRVELLR